MFLRNIAETLRENRRKYHLFQASPSAQEVSRILIKNC